MDTDSKVLVEGKAKGGKARAANMTAEQRQESARKAAAAKKELASLPRATHMGTLRLVDKEIPCAVLDDGTRVLTQSDFMESMGMYYSGWIAKNTPIESETITAEIPHFLAQKRLIPFINKHLGHLQNIVLKYRTEKGGAAHGIRAEIIPSICDIYIDADSEGKLGVRQKKIAQQAMLLMRALAHVGIVALVDEATGYQKDRERDALARILEEFIAKEMRPWMKTYPAEFFEELCRLREVPFKSNMRAPQYFGHLINNITYDRMAPDLREALKAEKAKSRKSGAKMHQFLSDSVGFNMLQRRLAGITTLMQASDKYEDFICLLDKVHPVIKTE